MKRLIIICATLTTIYLNLEAQAVTLHTHNTPLNQVLSQLCDEQNFQFSYSDNLLKEYTTSISGTFQSLDEVLDLLFKDLPFKVEYTNDVYIIVPTKVKLKKKAPEPITISGQIVEAGTYEPLPYSHVFINDYAMISNVMGGINFTLSSDADSLVHMKISHLGYYIFDTVFYASINQQFVLTPSNYGIPEITIKNSIIEKSTQIGENLGKITLTKAIAGFLPGQGDNAIFNFLRLMPGIQAAGEQSAEPQTWGSYEGQTQVIFDKFLLFGLKNFNDNISAINPLIVKSIDIHKSGYGARYSDRVGGIINITGKNGSRHKPSFCFNINPTTVNSILEVPITKKISLLAAYRQTYYNLYNSKDFNIFKPAEKLNNAYKRGDIRELADIEVYPESYLFRDFNLKFSYQPKRGDLFYISLYSGGDDFTLETETEVDLNRKGRNHSSEGELSVDLLSTENNHQNGMSMFYGKNWSNGLTTNFIVAYSDLNNKVTDQSESEESEVYYQNVSTGIENKVSEWAFRQENFWTFNTNNQLEFGAGYISDQTRYTNIFSENSELKIDTLHHNFNNRIYGYIQGNFWFTPKWSVKAGLHLNGLLYKTQLQLEPRINTSYQLFEHFKLSASWGIYHQYLIKQETVDRNNNYSYVWISDNIKSTPLRAEHYVLGARYLKNNFTINVEAYSKSIHHLTRRVFEEVSATQNTQPVYSLYTGQAKSKGIEIFIKKDFKHHSFWASYILSETKEQFALGNSYPTNKDYVLTPHDQRHEFKIAGIVNFGQWFFSANYVYGSGIYLLETIFPNENIQYNRIDAAITYQYHANRFRIETGISVLNALNTQNLKYANLKTIQLSELDDVITIYTNAVPLTPSVFIKLTL